MCISVDFRKFFQVSSVPGQPRVEDVEDFNRILIGFPSKSFGFLSKSFQILLIPFNFYWFSINSIDFLLISIDFQWFGPFGAKSRHFALLDTSWTRAGKQSFRHSAELKTVQKSIEGSLKSDPTPSCRKSRRFGVARRHAGAGSGSWYPTLVVETA